MKNRTKFILLTAAFLLLAAGTAHAQFRKAVGGSLNDESHSMVKTPDGGFAVAGSTNSYGVPGTNAYILKFNSAGSLQWSKSIGGVGVDAAYTIIATTDGGVAAIGWTSSFGAGDYDFYVIKLDASGNLQWNKTIGGAGVEYGTSIIQTSDGGYIAAGRTTSFGNGNDDILVAKLNSSGTIQWCKTAGGPNVDYCFSMAKTSDGGFVIAGGTMSFGAGSYDMFLLKYGSSGTVQWCKTAGGSGSDMALSVIQTTDGGYLMCGSTMSYGAGNYDMYFVKFTGAGSLSWTKTLGSQGYEFAASIAQTTDGGYITAGCSGYYGAGGDDIYIAKLSSTGSVQWQRTTGGSGNEYAYSIFQASDGTYCAAGYTESYGAGNSDIFITKFSSSGSICGTGGTPGGGSGSGGSGSTLLPVMLNVSPTVVSPAPIILSGGTVTTLCLTGIETLSGEIPSEFSLSQNYPNPFNPVTNINFSIPKSAMVKLVVYDAAGKEAATLISQDLNAGSYTFDFDASHLASGAYFYRLTAGEFTDVKKMMLIK